MKYRIIDLAKLNPNCRRIIRIICNRNEAYALKCKILLHCAELRHP